LGFGFGYWVEKPERKTQKFLNPNPNLNPNSKIFWVQTSGNNCNIKTFFYE
jgi:hypothetical protein